MIPCDTPFLVGLHPDSIPFTLMLSPVIEEVSYLLLYGTYYSEARELLDKI